jgi:hypothetical protein
MFTTNRTTQHKNIKNCESYSSLRACLISKRKNGKRVKVSIALYAPGARGPGLNRGMISPVRVPHTLLPQADSTVSKRRTISIHLRPAQNPDPILKLRTLERASSPSVTRGIFS